MSLAVDAYSQRVFKGRTYAFDSSLYEKTRTVLVRARVPNPSGELKPGMFARVTLTLDTQPGALLIPEEAIVPRGNQTLVFRVVDNKAVMTPIETGSRKPGVVQVLKGLSATDRVVTEGHQKLQDGMSIIDIAMMQKTPAAAPPASTAPAAKGAYL